MDKNQDAYDQAIFVQELRRKAKFNRVTRQDVIDAFWVSAWDLKIAIEEKAPDKLEEINAALDFLLPNIIARLEHDTNLRVIRD